MDQHRELSWESLISKPNPVSHYTTNSVPLNRCPLLATPIFST
ncbi:hypothetical protein VCRA2113O415_570005 [Vibrio crassostreae]|nr:hypothetical protein VCRA2113O415_570005 [Vibrio crassostreae]CAK3527224.1 hypothetical protein VCRA2121O436_540005 [Vibrio crassostreae]